MSKAFETRPLAIISSIHGTRSLFQYLSPIYVQQLFSSVILYPFHSFIHSQSPAPVCMFYFAHPFGISSAAAHRPSQQSHACRSTMSSAMPTAPATALTTARTASTPFEGQLYDRWHCMTASTQSTIDSRLIHERSGCFDGHVSAYVPWPVGTWRREFIWPLILDVWQQRQKG